MDCPLGDACQNAHNVFEIHLHPTVYRTELCTVEQRTGQVHTCLGSSLYMGTLPPVPWDGWRMWGVGGECVYRGGTAFAHVLTSAPVWTGRGVLDFFLSLSILRHLSIFVIL